MKNFTQHRRLLNESAIDKLFGLSQSIKSRLNKLEKDLPAFREKKKKELEKYDPKDDIFGLGKPDRLQIEGDVNVATSLYLENELKAAFIESIKQHQFAKYVNNIEIIFDTYAIGEASFSATFGSIRLTVPFASDFIGWEEKRTWTELHSSFMHEFVHALSIEFLNKQKEYARVMSDSGDKRWREFINYALQSQEFEPMAIGNAFEFVNHLTKSQLNSYIGDINNLAKESLDQNYEYDRFKRRVENLNKKYGIPRLMFPMTIIGAYRYSKLEKNKSLLSRAKKWADKTVMYFDQISLYTREFKRRRQ